jgi:hypothetical protein
MPCLSIPSVIGIPSLRAIPRQDANAVQKFYQLVKIGNSPAAIARSGRYQSRRSAMIRIKIAWVESSRGRAGQNPAESRQNPRKSRETQKESNQSRR